MSTIMAPIILTRTNGDGGPRVPHRHLINALPVHVPKFRTRPHNQIVKEGKDVRFECSVYSVQSKTTWDKDRRLLSPKLNPRLCTREADDLRILEIRQVTQEDAGLYRIVLESQEGRVDASVRLDVLAGSTGSEGMKLCWGSSSRSRNQDGSRNGNGTTSPGLGNQPSNTYRSFKDSGPVPALPIMAQKPLPPPAFLQHLQDMEVMEGDKVELVTKIRGAQAVAWTLNDQLLPNSPYCQYVRDESGESYKLVIRDVFPQDSGLYVCEAYNSSGGSISFANLTVSTSPGSIPEPLEKVSTSTQGLLQNGSKIKMESAIAAVDSIISEIERLELKEKGNAIAKHIDANSNFAESKAETLEAPNCVSELKSSSVRKAEITVRGDSLEAELGGSGASSLSLENELQECSLGSTESESEAEVAEATGPNSIESPILSPDPLSEISEGCSELSPAVRQGSPFSFPVVVAREPSEETNSSAAEVGTSIAPQSSEFEPEPKVQEPVADAEEYKEPRSSFSADDGTAGKSPSVMGPAYLIAMKEETVHVRIKYSGLPQPVVEWTHNGRECWEVEQNPELSSVRIDRVSYDDSGRYVAKVSNDHGTILHHCFLSVEGPPEPPSSPPQAAYNEGSNSISISWSGSPYDGGSMLTAYIIQASIDEKEWSDLSMGTWLTYSLHTPSPGSSYRFRVQAKNMYGPGPPSSVSPPVHIPGAHDTEQDEEETSLLEKLDVQLRPGSLAEYYTKGEELGKGRFGVVFSVTSKKDGEFFAGKIIRCIKAADKVKVRQEVEIMNILRHPKLLQIMDALENEREICIITEKVNGGELFERVVADDFTLTEFDCVGFMRQICDGVRFMHQKNIIHLDLKPENILCLTRSTYNIKIIDFGLSQKYDSGAELRVLFGTPEFISPEIINYEPIGPASDMWALGVITYVLLSGLSPFMGESDSETFSNITQGLFDFDDESFDHISEDAKDFISELLVRRQEKRMTPVECLAHKWLAYPEPTKNIVIPTDKLKRFIIRRKWQKTGNAIRALGRITMLYSSRRSIEAAASAMRKSDDSGIFENPKPKAASLSLEEEPEEEVRTERKRQLQRQNRVDSANI